MPREKKNNHPITIRMESSVYNKLEEYCRETGLTKTVSIEKAVEMYIADYRQKEKLIDKNINK